MKDNTLYEDDSERRYWLNYWHYGAFAIETLARLAHCLRLANQLQVNGIGFDIHIQSITPQIAGGITTSVSGFQEFNDIEDLDAILQTTMNWLMAGRVLRHVEGALDEALGDENGQDG